MGGDGTDHQGQGHPSKETGPQQGVLAPPGDCPGLPKCRVSPEPTGSPPLEGLFLTGLSLQDSETSGSSEGWDSLRGTEHMLNAERQPSPLPSAEGSGLT